MEYHHSNIFLRRKLITITLFTYLPTIMSSRSAACGRMRVQMSMVNRVLLLLKMEAKEDMRAANMTASISPRNPAQRGRRRGQSEDQRKVLKGTIKLLF